NPEAFGGLALFAHDRVATVRLNIRQPLRLRRALETATIALVQRARDRQEILAGIAVFGKGKRRIVYLAVARVDRARQPFHLGARVVDDPFGKNVVSAEAHRLGQRVADRKGASLHDDERARRVRASELERDALPVARKHTELPALRDDGCERVLPNGRSQSEVDEATVGSNVAKLLAQARFT